MFLQIFMSVEIVQTRGLHLEGGPQTLNPEEGKKDTRK